MQAVILAGGLGTRLGALAQDLPKPMVDVGGKPFLEHMICMLARQGIRDIVLLTGHRAEVIERHFGDGTAFFAQIRYSREPQPLGTGGALLLARDLLAPQFLLLFGDVLRRIDYAAFCARHGGNCLAVYPYDTAGMTTIACGNVDLGRNGRVACYRKGDAAAALPYVDAGFGVFTQAAVDLLPAGASSFETEVYDRLARQDRLDAEVLDRNFFDIGNPVDLARARAASWDGPCASS